MVVTNKDKFNKKYGFPKGEGHSKAEISKLTGISKSILDQVYDRGVGAHKTNPGSVRNLKGVKGGGGQKMSANAWAFGRIYSFVMGGKTRTTADKDLWEKHKKKK
jgi:hypothetical protein